VVVETGVEASVREKACAMNFDEAFELLIGHEGGYVNNPNDPGGETKYGISRRQYPGEDIANMTLERAKTIAKRDFWGPAGCDVVPDAVKFDLFDTAFNSGVTTAIKLLQRAASSLEDGKLGNYTLINVQSMDPERLLARFNGHRLDLLNNLPTWPQFGRGWTQRIAENLIRA
jgi:lysozyme family protein